MISTCEMVLLLSPHCWVKQCVALLATNTDIQVPWTELLRITWWLPVVCRLGAIVGNLVPLGGGISLKLIVRLLLVAPLTPIISLRLPLKDSPVQLNPLLPEVYISTLFPLVAKKVPFLVLARPWVIAQNLVQPQSPNLI